MNKLFALEDINTDGAVGELEVTPQEGEVADVQAEVEPEVAEIAEQTEAIDEGMGATDQLEQVEQVVEQAAEGEGLSEVSAEAIRIAVEAICARVGANPKTLYNMYAAENFGSASSRKANTRIALEGVSDFLKDMWKKIKAALENLWKKVKAFWAKHLSSLERVKKALESAKTNLSSSSGKLKDKAYIEDAPIFLKDAFGFDKDVSVSTIKTIIKTHADLGKKSDELTRIVQVMNAAAENMAKSSDKELGTILGDMLSTATKTIEMGTASTPLVGGEYITIKFEANKNDAELTMEVEREKVDHEAKLGLSLSDKAGVNGLLQDALAVINETIKAKQKTEKVEEAFNKFTLSIEKRINQAATTPESGKTMRKIMKIVYKANAQSPTINTQLVALNIKMAKAVLGFASVCMKHYK